MSAACAVAPHEQRWTSTDLGNVEVISSHDDATTRERVEDILRFRDVMKVLAPFGDVAPKQRTTVYLFADYRAFDEYSHHDKSQGFVLAQPSVNVVALDDSDRLAANRILYHEYAHLLQLADRRRSYPRWYMEGSAEYFCTLEFSRGNVHLGRVQPNAQAILSRYDWLPIEQVIAWDGSLDADEQTLALSYAQSWVLAHFLELGSLAGFEDRREQTLAYLQAVDAGASRTSAFLEYIGDPAGQFERELVKYGYRVRPPSVLRSGSEFEFDLRHEDPVELSPSRVHVTLAELALEIGPEKEDLADSLAAEAVRLDPNSSRAHVVRGRSLIGERNDTATHHFERALELSPRDAFVVLFYAEHLLRLMRAASNRAHVALVERLLAQVGGERSPLSMTHRLRAVRAELMNDAAGAIEALERAWELNRVDASTALELARLHVHHGDPVRGCALVDRVRDRPHRHISLEPHLATLTILCRDPPTRAEPEPTRPLPKAEPSPAEPEPKTEPTAAEREPKPEPSPAEPEPSVDPPPAVDDPPPIQRPRGRTG